ncbi:flagellar hook-associated protein FlgK [Oceaniglobus roseus]|uniref:flagellar hook-associated protein FlgK n=1 Tax=Oceaniglobus roseus TaxID=1737570 RepID=UPI000C7F3DAB|nr:flagellar hook-associated protein FlgK [Kandeliimicrobium roseum]
MSMSNALYNALSGLGAVSRSAQAVSSNVANALTEGYGRREVVLGSDRLGGVRVLGVTRIVNAAVLADRRIADADAGAARTPAGFLSRLQNLIGAADSPSSLPGRLATFEGRLIEAASRPDSVARLQSAAEGAADLASALNAAGQGVQDQRLAADRSIATQVGQLNDALAEIARLNTSITRVQSNSTEANALMDQRQVLIDSISAMVPLRELPRARGAVALVTTGGQILLDGRAAEIGFTASNAITAGMTLGGGHLSGLTVSGRPVDMSASGRMGGGSLAAAFGIRDDLGPEAQSQLDALAADLIERFQDPAVDPTLGSGDPGLLTDAGAVLVPPAAPGLAQRLSLNAAVDPANGEVWRLRDGLYASAEGPPGNAATLQALSDALEIPRPSPFGGSDRSAAGLFSELLSMVGSREFRAQQQQTFAETRAATLRERELAGGVDSDQEMQKLLLVEQSYAANAKVIQAVDDMLRRLMEI